MPVPENPWSYGLFIPNDPRAVQVARATVRHVLRATSLPHIAETAELLASEVVTNALRYSPNSDAYVSMDRLADSFLVTVWDTNPELPLVPERASPTAESGRGLEIVSLCADEWGVHDYTAQPGAATGKAVWFSLKA